MVNFRYILVNPKNVWIIIGLAFTTGFTSAQDFKEVIEEECAEEEVFTIVENMPEYPGGDAALLKFITENLPSPILSKDDGIPPMPVYVCYTVDKTGKVTNVYIDRGGDKRINPLIIELVQSIEGYKPGRQRGKPVPVKFTLPIRIHFK